MPSGGKLARMRVSRASSSSVTHLVQSLCLAATIGGCTNAPSSSAADLKDAGPDSTGVQSVVDHTSGAPLFGGGASAPTTSADAVETSSDVQAPAEPIVACAYAVGGAGSPLIDDFEDGNVTTLEHDGRAGTWFFYDDATGGARTDSVELDPQGERSGRVLSFATQGFTDWGSGFGVGFNWNSGQCTYDASAYDGVEFWLRGEGTARVTLQNLSVRPIALGGRCPVDAACFDSHGVDLTLPPTWTHFRLAFSEFEQAGWGTNVGPLDAGALYVLEFQFGSVVDHSLWLDDVTFYRRLTENDAGAPSADAGTFDAGTFGAGTFDAGMDAETTGGSSGRPDASLQLETSALSGAGIDASILN